MKNIKLYEYLLNQALLEEEFRYRDAMRSNCSSTELNNMKEKIVTMRANLLSAQVKTQKRFS